MDRLINPCIDSLAPYYRLYNNNTELWFDGMKTTADGKRLSMDIVIEDTGARGGGGGGNYGGGGDYGGGPPGGGGGASGQYQVEVIIVETRDPKAVLNEEPTPPN